MREVVTAATAMLLLAPHLFSSPRVVGPFPGQSAPAFTLPTTSGHTISLADLLAARRPVILHFWGPG